MKKNNQKNSSDIVIAGVLDYLSETGRENLLPEVADSLEELVNKSRKAEVIEIRSAISLRPEHENDLKEIIQKKFKLDLPVKNVIDKSLLGGFTIRVGDWFLDASLSNQLNKLKQSLLI